MEMCIDLPAEMIKELTGDSKRFSSPFSEFCGYSIWAEEKEGIDENDIQWIAKS